MAYSGGANNLGNIFRIILTGSGFQNLLSFNGGNGANPQSNLVLSGLTLYGMSKYGGADGDGTIFSISTDGSGFDDLLDFNGTNGKCPEDLTLGGEPSMG